MSLDGKLVGYFLFLEILLNNHGKYLFKLFFNVKMGSCTKNHLGKKTGIFYFIFFSLVPRPRGHSCRSVGEPVGEPEEGNRSPVQEPSLEGG